MKSYAAKIAITMKSISLICALLLLTVSAKKSCENGSCEKDPCEKIIDLKPISSADEFIANEKKFFFIESSDRPFLSARQLCSVESAYKHNPDSDIAVVLTSNTLDLKADKATCNIYKDLSDRVHFRHVDKTTFFTGTPLEDVYASGRLESSPHKIVHYSDAIRLVLIYKYGGWYADLDIIFLKTVEHLRNVIASDQLLMSDEERLGPDFWGTMVCNAVFNFDKGHGFLERAINGFGRFFDGHRWSSGGAEILNRSLMTQCGYDVDSKMHLMKSKFSKEQCNGVELLHPRAFYPWGYFDSHELNRMRSDEGWDEIFSDSFTVHFFATSGKGTGKILKPKNYGKERPALLYLALNNCPKAFDSVRLF